MRQSTELPQDFVQFLREGGLSLTFASGPRIRQPWGTASGNVRVLCARFDSRYTPCVSRGDF